MPDSTSFVPGDLVFFVYMDGGEPRQTGGIVIDLDEGLLTVRLPHGVELYNLRSPIFGRAWRVEHAPHEMTPEEALAFSHERLAELRRKPMMMVHPEDEGYRAPEEHSHADHGGRGHSHTH